MLIGLFAVIFIFGGYEIYGMFGGASNHVSTAPAIAQLKTVPASAGSGTRGAEALQHGLDPTLHLDRLALE